MVIFSHIVVCSSNFVIGKNNTIPWHLSEDLKRFRKLTTNHPILYGRRTFESIGSRPLPNRRNIIVSRTLHSLPGIEAVSSISAAQELIESTCSATEEIFIIGGGEIYRATLPLVSKIYMTLIYENIEGDSFYPKNFNKDNRFETVSFDRFHEPKEYAFWTLQEKRVN